MNRAIPELYCSGGVPPPALIEATSGKWKTGDFHPENKRRLRMNKISKRKMLFYISLLALTLIISVYASIVPMAKAAEPSAQDQTVSILNSVLGLNTQSCAISVNGHNSGNQSMETTPNQADFNLVSNQGSVRVSSSFINNTLQLLYLSNYTGTP